MAEELKSVRIRERGYEALFLLGSLVSLSMRPTLRHAMELDHQWGKRKIRQRDIAHLGRLGLVQAQGEGADAVLRLTNQGRRVFDGGRNPELAWERGWDGRWRMMVFDLPQRESAARTKFWRWLRANHFGRLQGSVWIAPDEMAGLKEIAEDAGFPPELCLMFTGELDAERDPRRIAASAWKFDPINQGYREYSAFAAAAIKEVRRKRATSGALAEVLQDDREKWWGVVQSDPLLPSEILPPDYQGRLAWKNRQKLHEILVESMK